LFFGLRQSALEFMLHRFDFGRSFLLLYRLLKFYNPNLSFFSHLW